MNKLLGEGDLVEEAASIRLRSHQVELSRDQQTKIDAFLTLLSGSPYAPPPEAALDADLLSLLIRQRRVVKVSDGVVFIASSYDEMVARIVGHIKSTGRITLAETRDLFSTSRKYAQALLEYLDQQKVTRRVGDERVLGSGGS
jgi:selenocysteine-specific elongation factor